MRRKTPFRRRTGEEMVVPSLRPSWLTTMVSELGAPFRSAYALSSASSLPDAVTTGRMSPGSWLPEAAFSPSTTSC